MTPFQTLDRRICAPLPINEIDTDLIYPSRFLSTTKRTGLGPLLFHDLRYTQEKELKPDFVLNHPHYQHAEILVVGDHFGCGSSREHAPWALLDFGVKCLISTRFGDIFLGNCFKNGILCITLPIDIVQHLMNEALEKKRLSVSLQEQKISTEDEQEFTFDIDSYLKRSLLQGIDEIQQTLELENQIDRFETLHRQNFPWIYSYSTHSQN